MASVARSLRTRLPPAGALFALLLGAALAEPPPAVPSVPPPPDYADASAWLCRPGRADVCARPTTATVLVARGRPATVTYKPDPTPPIDCFYVYPTVSRADGDNAPIAATDAETGAARLQLARFATVCRPFAPLYRQVTREGLGRLEGDPDPNAAPRLLAYSDIVAAWHAYLARDNAGRGFVLIGHSQGAKILARLIAAEIDGKPLAKRLVAAIIPGTEVDVPAGERVGGTFRHIPLCASATPGCVIAYSSYPAATTLPAAAHFGATRKPGMVYACVDPAAVAGTATLDADLPLVTSKLREAYDTDFVEMPGVLGAACERDGRFSILAVAVKGGGLGSEAANAILRQISEHAPTWGLHEIDVGLAAGTLVDIVRRQAVAYGRE